MERPAKVHVKGGRYYYVHQNKWTGLTRVDEGEPALRRALANLTSPAPRTVGQLFDHWHAADHSNLKPRTLAEYRRQVEVMRPVLGHMTLTAVKPGTISQYLERRGRVRANREIAALGSVFAWAMRKGWLDANPTHGVRRNPERPRTRYISNHEFADGLRRTTPAARDLLLAAYLTGLRQGDLRAMGQHQVTREGLLISESKRGKRLVITWNGPLRSLVVRAQARSKCHHLLTNTRGNPWTESAVWSVMRRLNVDWTFHDLRAKAESDHHEGMGLLSRYKRARRVSPVGGRRSKT